MGRPAVSILLPPLNAGEFLGPRVDSLLNRAKLRDKPQPRERSRKSRHVVR
jgi:hypothetical protein